MAMNSFALMGFWQSAPLIDRLYHDTLHMFGGLHPGYLPIDMPYHDLQHTLEASMCLCKILEGRNAATVHPPLQRRDCELALAAILLHDSGYLKKIGDEEGTGAKYTFVHVSRSCAVARNFLSTVGFTSPEIEQACDIINCTTPANRITLPPLLRPQIRIIAAIVVTSDYLSQMAAPNYVGKLPHLYRELTEAYDYLNIGESDRPFKREQDLIRQTSTFWYNVVKPMLYQELGGVCQYLISSDHDGINPYLSAIERNLVRIRESRSESASESIFPDEKLPPSAH